MIVTQADYTRWQNQYGQGNNNVKDSGAVENQSQVNGGQKFALAGGKDEDIRSTLSGSIREKSFLEEAFERTLNNRLGIDQGKMDELKKEIEKTETAIEALNKQKPHSEKQQKELHALEDKLKKLEDALNELVKQATERAIENDKSDQETNHLIVQYQSVASFL
jgi:chromosome segregation ATPase